MKELEDNAINQAIEEINAVNAKKINKPVLTPRMEIHNDVIYVSVCNLINNKKKITKKNVFDNIYHALYRIIVKGQTEITLFPSTDYEECLEKGYTNIEIETLAKKYYN